MKNRAKSGERQVKGEDGLFCAARGCFSAREKIISKIFKKPLKFSRIYGIIFKNRLCPPSMRRKGDPCSHEIA